MQLIINANWQDEQKMSRLRVPGLEVRVVFRGDVWEWEVLDPLFSIGSGWVDSRDDAKAAAEACIQAHFD